MDINPYTYSKIEFVCNYSVNKLQSMLNIYHQSMGYYFTLTDLHYQNRILFSEKDFFCLVSWSAINLNSCKVELKGWMKTNPFIISSTELTINLKGFFRFVPRRKSLRKFISLIKFLEADERKIIHINDLNYKKLIVGLFLRESSLLFFLTILLVIYLYFQRLNMVSFGLSLDVVIVILSLFVAKRMNRVQKNIYVD